MVVARPRVTPVASLARKTTSAPMRVPAMRPRTADAGGGGTVEAATSELLQNVVFGGYLSGPSAIGCDPGGATALRRWVSERGRGRRDHAHDSNDERPAAPSSRRALRPGGAASFLAAEKVAAGASSWSVTGPALGDPRRLQVVAGEAREVVGMKGPASQREKHRVLVGLDHRAASPCRRRRSREVDASCSLHPQRCPPSTSVKHFSTFTSLNRHFDRA
jgi:hypothetical protein